MRALFGKEYEMTIEEAVCYLKKQDLAALEETGELPSGDS